MKTLGLIGGIGSGKSTVAKMFVDLGASVIDADAIGHQVLLTDDVKTVARRRWGDQVFDETGELDRRSLALIVFAGSPESEKELDFLKSLTHPLIGREIERRVRQWEVFGTAILVLDIPLLLEAKWDAHVDKVLFVDAPREVRLRRAMQRGWTEAEFTAREATQWPLDRKRARADFIVQNDDFLDSTLDQIRNIWHNLTEE